MPSRGHANPRRGICVSSRWGWGPSASAKMSRLDGLLDALRKFYGALPKPPRDPFTLFVWEVLSMHSTPQKRDAALGALKRIPALTPDAMWRAGPAEIGRRGQ